MASAHKNLGILDFYLNVLTLEFGWPLFGDLLTLGEFLNTLSQPKLRQSAFDLNNIVVKISAQDMFDLERSEVKVKTGHL